LDWYLLHALIRRRLAETEQTLQNLRESKVVATESEARGGTAQPEAVPAAVHPDEDRDEIFRREHMQKTYMKAFRSVAGVHCPVLRDDSTLGDSRLVFADGFLKNLKVDDESQKQAFISGLEGVCSDASKMTREADAVLQVCCAASAVHDTQAAKIEEYLQVRMQPPSAYDPYL
jgi:hypothetical protein